MSNPSNESNRPRGGAAMFFFCGLLIGAAAVGFALAARSAREAMPEEQALREQAPSAVKPLHASNAPGLHNVYRLGETLYCGSSPDDEEAFASLSRLGVKTIISVDGAVPDVDTARAFGLKYVHLPMSYSGVPHETLIQLVRASRELPGPIYLHCHHGRHRGPAAAVSLWRCLDKSVTNEQAFAVLKLLGTADRYQGLYDSVRNCTPPKASELTLTAAADLPEVSPVPPLAKMMTEIDRMFDRVVANAKDTTTISMQLTTAYDVAEHFREAARLSDVTDELKSGLNAAADDLDKLAETIKLSLRDRSATEATRAEAMSRVKARCDECHAKFRD